MSADSRDGFEYEPAAKHISAEHRRHYWAVAIGLQRVDGLEVSPYLHELAAMYEKGTYSLAQTGDLIRTYHAQDDERESRENSLEADLVSQRIAELLEGAPFLLAPAILKHIHRYLFQDLNPSIYHPGEFKTERMVKQERILNGDSVLYADPLMYQSSLEFAFQEEATREYGLELKDEDLKGFVRTATRLWQVHPFAEGNTRTVAVFSEMYLNHLGFLAGNEPFEKHAPYYRGALVRSTYRNAQAKVLPDPSFLMAFYDNVVNDAGHRLDEADLICPQLFEHPEFLHNISPAEALVK